MGVQHFHSWFLGIVVLSASILPVRSHATPATSDLAALCTKPITIPDMPDADRTNALQKKISNYLQYGVADGTRHVLCFLPTADAKKQIAITKPLLIAGTDEQPLVIYGLSLKSAAGYAGDFLHITGANVTLRNLTLTGPGPLAAGSTGVALSGSGHQIVDSKITGFDVGVRADCAWPADASQPDAPSCTIGPNNTIGEYSAADVSTTKLVNTGVHVPSTGQQVTVTRNQITTVLDKPSADYVADTKRLVLDENANGGLVPPAWEQGVTLWPQFSEDQKTLIAVTGTLPSPHAIELYEERKPPPATYVKSCTVEQKEGTAGDASEVPEGTWVFTCDQLDIPVTNDEAKISLLTSRQHNTAAYVRLRLRGWFAPLPVSVGPLSDTIGGVMPTAPSGSAADDASGIPENPPSLVVESTESVETAAFGSAIGNAEGETGVDAKDTTLLAQAPTNVPGPNAELPLPDTPGIGQAPLPPAPPLGDTPLATAPTPAPPPDDVAGTTALGMTGASDGGLGSAPVTAGCSLIVR